MAWCLWIYLGANFIGMLIGANRHGKPREGKYNFFPEFIAWMLLCFLPLYFGGAFHAIGLN